LAKDDAITGVRTGPAQPTIRTIGVADLKDALAKGIDDFKAVPSHLVFLGLIYPIVTLVFARTYAGYDMLPVVFPLFAGFTLIGPVFMLGIYELSRRRELGQDVSLRNSFDVLHSPSLRSVVTLGIGLAVIDLVWLAVADIIYLITFGGAVPESVAEFVRQVFTTAAGWALIIVGCGVGFCFAVAVLTISVVSFPMLLDRDVGVLAAVQTSVRAVRANPATMAVWGLIVVVTLALGALPVFVGLAVVMPVLGHATWHLYRKVVAV
jgi:uncharacterized membrane protein